MGCEGWGGVGWASVPRGRQTPRNVNKISAGPRLPGLSCTALRRFLCAGRPLLPPALRRLAPVAIPLQIPAQRPSLCPRRPPDSLAALASRRTPGPASSAGPPRRGRTIHPPASPVTSIQGSPMQARREHCGLAEGRGHSRSGRLGGCGVRSGHGRRRRGAGGSCGAPAAAP